MPDEARGLPIAETGEGEELVVLLGLCLTEGLDECRLEGEVSVFSRRSQDEGLDLACGDVVEGHHDVVVLGEVGHDRLLTGGELGLNLGEPHSWAGHREGGQFEGHGVDTLEGLGDSLDIRGGERHARVGVTTLASLKSNAPKNQNQ